MFLAAFRKLVGSRKVTRTKTPSRSFVPRVESLEERAVLAGNITAAVAGGVLTLTGDASANQVQVLGLNGNIRVLGLGTTVNGSYAPQNFAGVTTLNATLNGGNDLITAVNATFAGDVTVDTGAGNDVVSIVNLTAAGALTVNTGDGNDVATLTNDRADSVNLNMGAGNDVGTLSSVRATTTITARMNGGDDILTVVNSSAATADLDGGANGRDRLIRSRNAFGAQVITNWEQVIG